MACCWMTEDQVGIPARILSYLKHVLLSLSSTYLFVFDSIKAQLSGYFYRYIWR